MGVSNTVFVYVTNLQYKVKSLSLKVSSFESGEKYVSMRAEFDRQLSAKDMENKKLKTELSKAHCEAVTMRKNWEQVFEDIAAEHDKALRQKDSAIKALGTQLLSTQQQLDTAKDNFRDVKIELYHAQTIIEDLQGQNRELKAQINRDYENSSIPSSQKPNHKKIANNREKTDRKIGGQPGHAGHPRKRYTPTSHVHIPAPDKYAKNADFKPTGKTIRKQVVNIRLTLDVIEYDTPEFRNVHTGQRVHANFPAGVVNEVNIGGSVKSAAFLLNNRYGVSLEKVSEFLYDISGGELKVSTGMINGLSKEFAQKTDAEQKKAFADILLSPVMNTDLTTARVNGKTMQVVVCCASGITMYFAREHKGHDGLAGTPVETYHGILVHDHDITFYSYGDNHQECLSHVLRYLKDSIENEKNLTWNQQMWKLLREMIHYMNGLPEIDPNPDKQKVVEFERRYAEVLELAKKEYEYEPPTKYYVDGYNLYERLEKYKESHLLFLHDVRVSATNNLCERKGRVFKRKQRQVMSFRSFESVENLCNSMSIMDLFKARKENLFESVTAVFN